MKDSVSHSYKIIHVSDESPVYKISHIENKNPSVFWRTSQVSEYAYFEIKFTPIKLHHIEVSTSLAPQIEIEAFNKDEEGTVTDLFNCVPKVTMVSYNDFMGGKSDLKSRRFDLFDKLYMVISFANFTFIFFVIVDF